jgi:NifU-like protein involved in Fe-S cluster formation
MFRQPRWRSTDPASISAPVTAALYNRDILRLAASIPHLGRLDAPQASADKRSPLCGSRVAVDIALDREGRVAALGLEVKACALGQASASLMAANAVGRTPAELASAREELAAFLAGRRDDAGAWPGLVVFAGARPFTARHPSILLAFQAAAEAAALAAGEAAPAAAASR